MPPGSSRIARLPLKPSPFSKIAEQGPEILAQAEVAMNNINTLLNPENQKLLTQALAQMGEAAR